MVLTTEQKRLVRESFERISAMGGPIALLFYGKLFQLEPGARGLFHNDLRLQGQKLMDTLRCAVDALDHFDEMHVRLADLGRRHAEIGVKPEQYRTLQTALLWSLGQALGQDFRPDTRAAWSIVIESMQQAMIPK